MANEQEYVLWLPSWYPNKLTPFDGDFIQRQAQAVSAFMPVHVLYLVKDEGRVITNNILVEVKEEGNLKETIIYYTSSRFFWKPIEKFLALAKFGHLYRKFLRNYLKKQDLPAIVHVHVALKAGLIAKWIRRTYGVPYVLTEHWTIYLEEAKPQLNDLSFARQYIISQVVSEATKTITVSHHLGKAMLGKWPFLDYQVIPNVVNRDIFYPTASKRSEKIRILHASALNYQKDPESLFRAAGILKSKGFHFQLDIFGPTTPEIILLAKNAGVEHDTRFHGEVPQSILAEFMRESDVMILYSRFETFGCVIIEANACGIPVIVTDTPLMHEIVVNGVNGFLVAPGNPELLAKRIIEFAESRDQFNLEAIRKTTDQYSYERIGLQHMDMYNTILYPLAVEEN